MIVCPPAPGVQQDEWFATMPAKSQFELVTNFVIVSMHDEDLPRLSTCPYCRPSRSYPETGFEKVWPNQYRKVVGRLHRKGLSIAIHSTDPAHIFQMTFCAVVVVQVIGNTVTAEAAGSSRVVPAILLKHLHRRKRRNTRVCVVPCVVITFPHIPVGTFQLAPTRT